MRPSRFASYRPHLEALECRLTMSGPGSSNPGILPPQSHPFGASYGEWSARWWQWAYSLPVDHHPLYDTAGVSTGQSGKVWYLGASFAPSVSSGGQIIATANRSATVPSGVALFFPVANAEASTLEGNGTTDAELRAAARSFQDLTTNMSAEIDGTPVRDLGAYRVQSPLYTFGPLPDNNVLQSFGIAAPAGSTSLSVADGVYLMLAPLSTGQHTIHFHAETPAFNFLLDITYNLTVAPGNSPRSSVTKSLPGSSPIVVGVLMSLPAAGQPHMVSAGANASPVKPGLPALPVTAPGLPASSGLTADNPTQSSVHPRLGDAVVLDHLFAGPWEGSLSVL